MMIEGDVQVQYGMTPAGQMFELHKVGKIGILRVTPDPEKFLFWMIQSEINREQSGIQRKRLVAIIKPWWEKHDGVSHRGQFNEDLYYKIIEAKRSNGTLYR